MNGFELRRKKKMDDILDAAFELFTTVGVESANINSIAKKAGVAQGSIYNFFGSKENLIKQVVFRMMDKSIIDFESIVESDISFHEKIKKIQQLSFEEYSGYHEGFSSAALINDPQMLKFLEEVGASRAIPLYIKLIEKGKHEGVIDKDLSSNAVFLYINAISAILRTDISTKERFDLGKLLFYGLFGNTEEKAIETD